MAYSLKKELLPTESQIKDLFDQLWPICRSLTGKGLRDSFRILNAISEYQLSEIPSGTRVFDWTIPKEWNIDEAYIETPSGSRIADFRVNNLHVMGYSVPVEKILSLDELQKHLYSIPEHPDWIPYRTSYYAERWGFCLQDSVRRQLKPGQYKAIIRSSLQDGSMTLGESRLASTQRGPQSLSQEFLFTSYLCHPSMANNELSGPIVLTFLKRYIESFPNRRHSYRFVLVPETLGTIAYLHQNQNSVSSISGGLVITCVGDSGSFTYKKTRDSNHLIDRIVIDHLKKSKKPHKVLDFFPTGSDERQYNSPGFRIPVGSLMRTMYGEFPEYHTSADNAQLVTPCSLLESLSTYIEIFHALEANRTYKNLAPFGEPMLGPRGLYPTVGSATDTARVVEDLMWVLNDADGTSDLLSLAERSKRPLWNLVEAAQKLFDAKLIEETKLP